LFTQALGVVALTTVATVDATVDAVVDGLANWTTSRKYVISRPRT
jgi:hypothetical protein